MVKKISLKESIERRKQEAQDKNIYHRALSIVKFLGRSDGKFYETRQGDTENGYIFQDSFLRIECTAGETYVSDYGCSVSFSHVKISYKEKVVFISYTDSVETYVPGKWEKKLEELYPEASKRENKLIREKAAQEKHKQDLEEKIERNKWGL